MTISAVNPMPRIHPERKACLIEIMTDSLNSQRNGVRQIEMEKKRRIVTDDSAQMEDRRSHKQPSWRDGRQFFRQPRPGLARGAAMKRALHG